MVPDSLSRKTMFFKGSAVDLVDVFAALHEINTYEENEELKQQICRILFRLQVSKWAKSDHILSDRAKTPSWSLLLWPLINEEMNNCNPRKKQT